jgi:hypothetical protein
MVWTCRKDAKTNFSGYNRRNKAKRKITQKDGRTKLKRR